MLFRSVTGELKNIVSHVAIYPASHYIAPPEKMRTALTEIEEECNERVKYFQSQGKLIEAQRIAERTRYDMEMMQMVIAWFVIISMT